MSWHRLWIPALAFALLACGANEPTPAPPDTLAQAETPVVAATQPAKASPPHQSPRPYPCIPGDPTAGARHYATLCASCHGPRGAGDGPAAASLYPKPAQHDDGAVMNGLSNAHLYKVIAQGGAAAGRSVQMPAWGSALGKQGVWDVLAFVRSLAKPPYTCP